MNAAELRQITEAAQSEAQSSVFPMATWVGNFSSFLTQFFYRLIRDEAELAARRGRESIYVSLTEFPYSDGEILKIPLSATIEIMAVISAQLNAEGFWTSLLLHVGCPDIDAASPPGDRLGGALLRVSW